MHVSRLPGELLHQVLEIFLRQYIHECWTDPNYLPSHVESMDSVEALLLTSCMCHDITKIVLRGLFVTDRSVELPFPRSYNLTFRKFLTAVYHTGHSSGTSA
jgi:hypothetical protein